MFGIELLLMTIILCLKSFEFAKKNNILGVCFLLIFSFFILVLEIGFLLLFCCYCNSYKMAYFLNSYLMSNKIIFLVFCLLMASSSLSGNSFFLKNKFFSFLIFFFITLCFEIKFVLSFFECNFLINFGFWVTFYF